MLYPITFVSLGPGDPELVTLKGLKRLQQSDIIFTPATMLGSGELTSRAENIILSLGIEPQKIENFHLPMSRDRGVTLAAYAELAQRAISSANRGKRVVITAEGDAGFYSSVQYVEEMLWKQDVKTERVAGVPAFIDCARLVGTHIVNQDRSFEVISRVNSAEQLLEQMSQDKSIVLMKVSQWEQAIKVVIAQSDAHTFYYIENCGVDGKEFYTSDKEEILSRRFPYFAIIIIKQRG